MKETVNRAGSSSHHLAPIARFSFVNKKQTVATAEQSDATQCRHRVNNLECSPFHTTVLVIVNSGSNWVYQPSPQKSENVGTLTA